MRLGIDLDNTIICYDRLFAKLASELQLVPPDVAKSKQAIRNYLRAQNQEDRWTELQGIAYGSRIEEAVPFDGVQEFFSRCSAANVEWWIISHRTQQPYLGESVDLHAAARQWLLSRGFISDVHSDRVRLEVTREAKLQCIAQIRCEWFIDDLPEFLSDPEFPKNIRRILFDPQKQNGDSPHYQRASSWSEISNQLGV
jgi:hypothetical protein